jgi:hypothetical protein
MHCHKLLPNTAAHYFRTAAHCHVHFHTLPSALTYLYTPTRTALTLRTVHTASHALPCALPHSHCRILLPRTLPLKVVRAHHCRTDYSTTTHALRPTAMHYQSHCHTLPRTLRAHDRAHCHTQAITLSHTAACTAPPPQPRHLAIHRLSRGSGLLCLCPP